MKNDILVVDDDPAILALVDLNLRHAGFRVETEGRIGPALQRLKVRPPDLVVLDVAMPDMDGWEFCKRIKDDPGLRGVKVLFLTGRDSPRDRLVGTAILGADGYLTKPFDPDGLIRRIREICVEG